MRSKRRSYRAVTTALILVLLSLCTVEAHADKKDSFIKRYPTGGYGVTLSGNYNVMPDGQLVAPEEFRTNYTETEYGPIVGDGLLYFPGFTFDSSRKKTGPADEDKDAFQKQHVFYDTTTQGNSALWGVSDPLE